MDSKKLQELKQKYLAEVEFRLSGKTQGVDYKYNIMVCGGTGCKSCKSQKVQEKLNEIIQAKGLQKDRIVNDSGGDILNG